MSDDPRFALLAILLGTVALLWAGVAARALMREAESEYALGLLSARNQQLEGLNAVLLVSLADQADALAGAGAGSAATA